MNTLFYTVLNMSAVGAIITLFVVFVRLFLKKSPKIFSCILWSAVLFRLLCPVSFSLPFSAVPETVSDGIFTENGIRDFSEENADFENSYIEAERGENITAALLSSHSTLSVTESKSENSLFKPELFTVSGFIWLAGAAAMALCGAFSFIKLKGKLREAVLLRENIYVCDKITTPFVKGIFSPKIYLPVSVKEEELQYIILHERCHIKRGDHIIRLLSFAVLCFHWFNPFIWLAFCLSGRDMEMSCDEAVMDKMKEDVRADYSASLLNLSAGKRVVSGIPLAFGESSVKQRIKNILKYKKPAVIITVLSSIVIVFLSVIFIGNPIPKETPYVGTRYKINECLWADPSFSVTGNALSECSFFVTSDGKMYKSVSTQEQYKYLGELEKTEFSDVKKSIALCVTSAAYDEKAEKQAKKIEKLLKKGEQEAYFIEGDDDAAYIIPCTGGSNLIVCTGSGELDVTHIFSADAKSTQTYPASLSEFAAKDALKPDELPYVFYTFSHSDYDGYVLELWEIDGGMGCSVLREQEEHGEYRYTLVTSRFYPKDEKSETVITTDSVHFSVGGRNLKFSFALGNISGAYEIFAADSFSDGQSQYIGLEEIPLPSEKSPFGSVTVSEADAEIQWFYMNSRGENVPIPPAPQTDI